MLDEYRRRGEESDAFAPWFSIDPPFPDGAFGDPKLVGGAYINGGIFPLVGGELARAALEHGREAFGVQILRQYADLIRESGETYLWYFPDGRPSSEETSTSPEAMATDGWGSSAMLFAFVEGLAGIVDEDRLLRRIRLAPRWPAAGVSEASVTIAYGASDAGVSYEYSLDDGEIRLRVEGSADVSLHAMLPEDRHVTAVQLEGEALPFETVKVGDTNYVDATFELAGRSSLTITMAPGAAACHLHD